MKKLALIGIAVLGLSLMIAVSPAGARPSLSKAEYALKAPGKPALMTLAEYRALMLRSEALNRLYQAPGKPALITLAEYRALMLRSEGLNQKYGIGQFKKVGTTPLGENYFARGIPTQTPVVDSSNTTDFNWSNVGIGIAGLMGLIAIAALAALGVRRHGPHPRTS